MYRNILGVLLIAFISGLSACHAAPGANAVLQSALFPQNPTKGMQKYGCTYDGAWQTAKQTGTVQVQGDDNRDGVKEASERRSEKYTAYYEVHLSGEAYDISPTDTAASEGAFQTAVKNSVWLKNKQGEVLSVSRKIGDVDLAKRWTDAVYGAESSVPVAQYDTVSVQSIRGPFSLRVDVSLHVTVSSTVIDDVHNTPDWVINKAELDAKIAAWRVDKLKIALDIMRQAMAPLDSWCRTPIAQGKSFKGLYPFITMELLPTGSELPTNTVPHKLIELKQPEYSYDVTYDEVKSDGSQYSNTQPHLTFRVTASMQHMRASDETDDAAIQWAQERMKQLRGGQAFTIPDADEAYRSMKRDVGTNMDTITFRKANVIITVTTSEYGVNIPAHPIANTERWAKFILAKLMGKQPEKLGQAASVTLLGAAKLWADSTPVTYTLIVKNGSAQPVTGAAFNIEQSDSMLGACRVSQLVTDASGKASISYTPKLPGTNTLTVSGKLGSASISIKQGGLVVSQPSNERMDAFGDGKTAAHIIVKCVNPDGQPVAGVKITAVADEKALPAKGVVNPKAGVSASNGVLTVGYTPPDVRKSASYKAASVYFNFAAILGSPARKVSVPWRLRVVRPSNKPILQTSILFTSAQVLNHQLSPRWVTGKPAVLRTQLSWSNPKVTSIEATVATSVNGKQISAAQHTFKQSYTRTEIAANKDAFHLVYVPDQSGVCDIAVTIQDVKITATDQTDYDLNPITAEAHITVAKPNRRLQLLFVPIAVGDWQGMERIDKALFDQFRQAQMRYLQAIYPLPSASIIDTTTSTVMFVPEQTLIEPIITEAAMLARVEALAAQYSNTYVIGVVPEGWFRHAGTSAPGRFPHAGLVYMTTTGGSIDTLTAHELTHLIGFNQHNNPAANADPGMFIWGSKPEDYRVMQREPNSDYFDYMNIDPTSSVTSWINVSNYHWLFDHLTTP